MVDKYQGFSKMQTMSDIVDAPEPLPHNGNRSRSGVPDLIAARQTRMKAIILAELEKGASLGRAAEVAGIDRRTVNYWREADESFEAEVLDAIERGTDELEDEAKRRASEGNEEIVTEFDGDGDVTARRVTHKRSDTLLMFLLNGRRSEKFRPKNGATNVNIDNRTQTVNTLAPETLELLQRIAVASGGNYERGKGEGEK